MKTEDTQGRAKGAGSRHRVMCVRAIIATIVLAVAGVVIYIVLGFSYGIDDGYALWGASDMVIDYMRTHNGNWPRSWEDLRPQFNANNGRVGGWSFSHYQDRVAIDFNADPDQLRRKSAASPQATFRVIWAKWPFGVTVGDGPNQMLCDYFRQQSGLPIPGRGVLKAKVVDLNHSNQQVH
jgi:hypothetical protein